MKIRKRKRFLSLLLALLLIISVPVESYATSAAVTAGYSVGGYVLNLILNACGIDFSFSSVTALLGEWSDYEDYMKKGAKGQLGSFSQYLFNMSQKAETAQAKEEWENIICILNDAVHASWGAVVSGVKPLIQALKSWLKSLAGYGTDTVVYTVSSPPPIREQEWTNTEAYCTQEYYSLPPPSVSDSVYDVMMAADTEYWFTSYGPSDFDADASFIRNWYHTKGFEVFGLFDPVRQEVALYGKKAGGGYEPVSSLYWGRHVYLDGGFVFSAGKKMGYSGVIPCESRYLTNLPFTVFMDIRDMEAYCQDGTVNNIAKIPEIALKALAVNPAVQNAALTNISDTITLPDSAEAAAKQAESVSAAVSDVSALKSALGAAGLVVGWDIDVTGNPGITDTDRLEIMEKLTAIPGLVADAVFDKMRTDGDTAAEEMSIPSIVISKFPFCIPFDLIYLVKILAAEKKAPRIEIPFRIHYEGYHYEHVFVVDFADFAVLVNILRIMLDLFFCACLISGTRALIKG